MSIEQEREKNKATVTTQQQKPAAQVKGTKVQDIKGTLDQTQDELNQARQNIQEIKKSQKISRSKVSELKKRDEALKKAVRVINQTKREAKATKTGKVSKSTAKKILKAIKPPGLDTSKSPINVLAKQSKTYYKAGGLERGISGRGNKPQNMDEYVNRLKYLGSQITIGGLKEFTYPASSELGKPKDTGETLLQITGGLLTPSPLDLAAVVAVRKLKLSSRGRKLLNKVLDRLDEGKDPFKNIDEARQWEKMVGKDGLSTDQIRNADKAELKKWMREIEEYYAKNPKAVRTQQLSEEIILDDMAITDLDWTDDQYINFLEAYKNTIRPDLAVAILSNLPDSKRKDIIGTASDDIEKIREEYQQSLIDKQKQKREYEKSEVPKIGEELESWLRTHDDEEPEQDVPTIPDPDIPVPPEQIPDEPPTDDPDPLPPTPPLILSKEDEAKRRIMNLRFYNGPIAKWRIKYSYPKGKSETLVLEARSLVDALGKAQRNKRPNKYKPNLIDVKKVKK